MIKNNCFIITLFICFALSMCVFTTPVTASDMRAAHQGVEQQKQQLLEKARIEKELAKTRADAEKLKIINDKKALKKAMADLKADIKNMTEDNRHIQARIVKLVTEEKQLKIDLEETAAVNREFRGVVQTNAKDLKALLVQNLLSGLEPGRHTFLEPIVLQQKFPTMDDVNRMAEQLFQTLRPQARSPSLKGKLWIAKARKDRPSCCCLEILPAFTPWTMKPDFCCIQTAASDTLPCQNCLRLRFVTISPPTLQEKGMTFTWTSQKAVPSGSSPISSAWRNRYPRAALLSGLSWLSWDWPCSS